MTLLNGALPPFVPDGGAWTVVTRGLVDAGLFSGFGSQLFIALILPGGAAGVAEPDRRRLRMLSQASLLVAGIALLLWSLGVAGSMAGVTRTLAAAGVLPTVLRVTSFGHLVLLQGALLAVAAGLVRRRMPAAWCAVPAALALLLQALHGHAASMTRGPSLLLLSDMLHLLAGGAWLGGLLPLLLTVRDPAGAMAATRRFSSLGRICVLTIALTALFQGWVLVGSLPALPGTAYGWVVCLKLSLFGLLLAIACLNQFRLAPLLSGGQAAHGRRRLVASIAVEALIGLGVVLAAGLLATLPPGMHTQAIWPFTLRPSWDTVREDAGFRRELVLALAGLALAGFALAAALFVLRRRFHRWVAATMATGLVVLSLPHLDLLLVEATPTSFIHSPTGFAAASIVAGAALYPTYCAGCHGLQGRGDGPAARSLPVPPADLTAAHLWMHSDGELFWWLTHGIDSPVGDGLAMPGFATVLDPDQRWALIDFIRARNAGLARAGGQDAMPVRAPSFQAACAGGRVVTLSGLHGQTVRLTVAAVAAPDPRGVSTILIGDPAARGAPRFCVAADRTILQAYRIASGRADGRQFLVDANGWLRAAAPSPSDDMGAVLARIMAAPLPEDAAARAGTAMSMDMPM